MGTGKIDIILDVDVSDDGTACAIVEHLRRPWTPGQMEDAHTAALTSQAALDTYMGGTFPWYSAWGSDKRGHLRTALLALP